MNIFGRFVEFEHPEYLLYSWVPVFLVMAMCLASSYWLKKLQKSYANPEHLKRSTRTASMAGTVFKTLGWGLTTFALCAALSEPYEKNADMSVPQGSLHVVGAFDVSLSMAAEDYRFVRPTKDGGPPIGAWGSRLGMAKEEFSEQIFKAIPGNKIGLVTYTADGYPQSPLVEDYGTVRYILNDSGWMGILSAPGGGSDYVQGMRVAIHTLRRDFDASKRQVILLFSDGGAPTFEDPEETAKWQKEYTETMEELNALRTACGGNLSVIVVGVGGPEEQMIPVYNGRTGERVDWFPLDKEEKAKTKLDDAGLRELASKVGGTYVWLNTDGKTKLPVNWASVIGGQRTVQGKLPLSSYPLGFAMSVMAALILRGLFRPSDQIATRPLQRGSANA
ncbi:MAG: VWA domain-containing protein [Candidatus Melainabacteria bacterium]|nr:VWA domain-containing protein [Candidatus Melainabacteria bacterium]